MKMLRLEEIESEESCSQLGNPRRVEASLRLDFRRDGTTGQTILAESVQEPPWRVIRAFPLEGGAVLAHLHNISGGLLGGDHLRLSIRAGAGTNVQVTTTGAMRLYRPRARAFATVQENDLHVQEGAILEYVPDAIIPYAGVQFAQRTSVQLSEGAGLFWWETVAPGREARGETFQYERLELNMEMAALGRPIAIDHMRLEPRVRSVSSPARLGAYSYFATFYICRVGLGTARWLEIEQELRELAGRQSRPGQLLWGVSALAAEGLTVRCLAVHGCDVLPGLYAFWQAAKRTLYGCEPIPPRKIH